MAKKEVVRVAKLQFNAGQAKPGPALAGLGIVMPEFTRQFNDATRDRGSEPVPVAITIYKDKSFDFKLFTSPASYKIKQLAKIESGSSNSKTTKVAKLTLEQLREIAQYKLVDLNTKKSWKSNVYNLWNCKTNGRRSWRMRWICKTTERG